MKYHFVSTLAMWVLFALAVVVGVGEFYQAQYAGYVLIDLAGWVMIGAGVCLIVLDIMLYETKSGHGHYALISHLLHVLLAAGGLFIAFRRDLWPGHESEIALIMIGLYAIIFFFHIFTGHHGHHRERRYEHIS